MDYVDKGATIHGAYRYLLWREWETNGQFVYSKPCVFVMLNPSIADAEKDDPTIRKCVGFAHRWKYEKLVVVNLFGACATQPADLFKAEKPIGPFNSHFLREAFSEAGKVICAWGMHGCFMEQDKAVIALMDEAGVQPYALGLTKYGFPNHPLYHPYGEAIKWNTPL